MNEHCMIPVIKTIKDPSSADDSLTVCVEIFEVGSATPAHRHNFAVEMFFILKGEGIAVCDGKEIPLHSGDSVLMPKTGTHYLQNTGEERLYALCMMVPNEDFSELIRSGVPATLDEQDLAVLSRIN